MIYTRQPEHFIIMFFRSSFLLLTLSLSTSLYASTQALSASEQRLLTTINGLLNKGRPTGEKRNLVQVATLLSPARQLSALCAEPVLTLAGNERRLVGRRSVVATCGARRHYLTIQVRAQGTWWLAKNRLAAGSRVSAGDIEPFTGSLEHQPDGIIFDAAEIIGQITTRAIAAGSPLRQNQLRQHWRLRNGQTVEIVTLGKGFRIRSAGKALANATVDDMLKVQTRGGQTVSGKVNADGQVVIFLQE